jgi:hypothetical protein
LLAEEDPIFEKKRSKVLLMAEKETMAAQSSERWQLKISLSPF